MMQLAEMYGGYLKLTIKTMEEESEDIWGGGELGERLTEWQYLLKSLAGHGWSLTSKMTGSCNTIYLF